MTGVQTCALPIFPTELKSLTALDEDFTLNDNDFCGTFASGDQLPPNLPNTFDVDTEVKANTFIGPTPCPATYALTAFYKATKVTNWAPTPSTTTRWMIGDPCTNSNGAWYGITCSTGGASTEVLKLELEKVRGELMSARMQAEATQAKSATQVDALHKRLGEKEAEVDALQRQVKAASQSAEIGRASCRERV